MSIFSIFKGSMNKTRGAMSAAQAALEEKLTPAFYDQVEEQLILADAGAAVARDIVTVLRGREKSHFLRTRGDALNALRELLAQRLAPDAPLALSGKPAVLLFVGVNGVGKTTSVAKVGHYFAAQGKKVLLAAGDTFRAAAGAQLDIWAGRAGLPIVRQGEGADPSAVLFDAVTMAGAKGYDLVLADTAGRLHNKKNLMDELAKMARVCKKAGEDVTVETLLVLDAVTGQNAIAQARQFMDAAGADGVVLTKLDGSARGGCVLAVKQTLGLPVRFVGVGEGMDDLLPFDPQAFAAALFPEGCEEEA